MQLGWSRWSRGGSTRACELFEVGWAVYTGSGLHTATPALLSNVALALLAHGRRDAAEQYAARARAELDAHGEEWPAPVALLAEAELAAERGEDAGDALRGGGRPGPEMGAAGMLQRIERAASAPGRTATQRAGRRVRRGAAGPARSTRRAAPTMDLLRALASACSSSGPGSVPCAAAASAPASSTTGSFHLSRKTSSSSRACTARSAPCSTSPAASSAIAALAR